MRTLLAVLCLVTLSVSLACSSGGDTTPELDAANSTGSPDAASTSTPRSSPTPFPTSTPKVTATPATLVYTGVITLKGQPAPEGTPVEIRAGSTPCGDGVTALVDGKSIYSIAVIANCGGKTARELYYDGSLIGKVSAAGGEHDFEALPAEPITESTVTPSAEVVMPAVWSEAVCASLGAWLGDLTTKVGELEDQPTPEDLVAGRDAMVAFFDDLVASSDTLVDSAAAAGTPDSIDGLAIATAFVHGFDRARAIIRTGRESAAELPTTDATAFRTAVNKLVTNLEDGSAEVNEMFATVDEDYDVSGLAPAFSEAPSCTAVFGATGPFVTA